MDNRKQICKYMRLISNIVYGKLHWLKNYETPDAVMYDCNLHCARMVFTTKDVLIYLISDIDDNFVLSPDITQCEVLVVDDNHHDSCTALPNMIMTRAANATKQLIDSRDGTVKIPIYQPSADPTYLILKFGTAKSPNMFITVHTKHLYMGSPLLPGDMTISELVGYLIVLIRGKQLHHTFHQYNFQMLTK